MAKTKGNAEAQRIQTPRCHSSLRPCASASLRLLSRQARSIPNPLSLHADYWNSLGWKDPFSQEAFSERQRD
ncbi:MAG: DUF1223 domain-containing protein [Planctomyces sp.]|nr:DUF1223 domain-containing protein [Planctomyces sp.]